MPRMLFASAIEPFAAWIPIGTLYWHAVLWSALICRKESIVTSTEEYASRGMLVDIFPINHEHPIRIEYFGNSIDITNNR